MLQTITSSWRKTGQWPISWSKAHRHDDCQEDVEKRGGWAPELQIAPELKDGPLTLKTSRQIKDISLNKSPGTRYKLTQAAKAFENQEFRIMELETEVARLKEALERSQRSKKRRKIPNPNKGFQTMTEAWAAANIDPLLNGPNLALRGAVVVEAEVKEDDDPEEPSSSEDEPDEPAAHVTRSGRETRRPQRLQD